MAGWASSRGSKRVSTFSLLVVLLLDLMSFFRGIDGFDDRFLGVFYLKNSGGCWGALPAHRQGVTRYDFLPSTEMINIEILICS